MISYTLITVRESADIPWHVKNEEIETYIQTTYRDTGIITSTIAESNDFFMIKNINFKSKEDQLKFANDPALAEYFIERNIYEQENGITRFKS